jgi:hypothetical protein
MDRYTRYYLEQSGEDDIGPVYRARFRVQKGYGIGSFFKGLFLYTALLFRSESFRD